MHCHILVKCRGRPRRQVVAQVRSSQVWISSLSKVGPIPVHLEGYLVVNRLPWKVHSVEIVEVIVDFRLVVGTLVLSRWRVVQKHV